MAKKIFRDYQFHRQKINMEKNENVQLTVSSLRGAQRRSNPEGLLDCFVAALLAMTTQLVEHSEKHKG